MGWAVRRIAAKNGMKRRIVDVGSVDYTMWEGGRI
jgi:hypothetical protein